MKKFLLFLFSSTLFFEAPAQKPLPSNMFSAKLDNGLEVLVVEDNAVPLATIELAVKNGAYTESDEFNGLSHLYEHMFFKANSDYPDQGNFLSKMQQLGIQFNGNTSDEKVSYYFTLPKENLHNGLKLMSSAIKWPIFNEKDIQKENTVVDAEFQRNESNPLFALRDAMNHHMWGEFYSRKNPIGNHLVINTANKDKLREIKDKYYWPNNSLLIVAGDVNHAEVMDEVKDIFGSWKSSGFDPFEKFPIQEFSPLKKNDFFIVESKEARVPVLLYEWQGPDTRNDTKNTYVADIFSFILTQNSSRLHKVLVESGLALQMNTNYLTEKFTGPITFFIVPNPSKIKECVEAFTQELAKFDNPDYFTDEQLAISKRLYEIRQIRDQEITSDFVHTLSYWWCSASIDYFNTYLDNLNAVNREDIKKYVQKYIKDKPHCAGLLIDPNLKDRVNPETFFKAE